MMGKGSVRRVDGGIRYEKAGEESNQNALHMGMKLSENHTR